MKPSIPIGRWLNWLFKLAGFFLPQSLPRPLWLGDILDGVRLSLCISGAEIERAEIDRIVSLGVYDSESHANKTALGWRTLTLCVELQRAFAKLKSIEPDDIQAGFVELDGWSALFF
jgi:hypothetical protein